MKYKWPRRILITLLLAFLAACRVLPGGANPDADDPLLPAGPTARQAGSNPTIHPESPPPFLDLDDPQVYIPQGGETTQTALLDLAYGPDGADAGVQASRYVSAPEDSYLSNYTIFGPAVAGGREDIEISSADGKMYIYSNIAGCIPALDQPINVPYRQYFEPGSFLTGRAEYMGPGEAVEGRPVFHYRLEKANFLPGRLLTMAELREGVIAVSQDGGKFVRLAFSGSGTVELLTGSPAVPRDIRYQLAHTQFGQTLEVGIPENCYDPESGETPYPVMEDARDLVIIPGLMSYLTGVTLEEVNNFYQESLPPLGWLPVDAVITGSEGTIIYENSSGKNLTVIITPEKEGGLTEVIVLEGLP